jgi:phenylacetate-coenzyme A ligase PaaK-like adenylate-forming protein
LSSTETFEFEEIASIPPFSLNRDEKGALYGRALRCLTSFHRERCGDYGKIIKGLGFEDKTASGIEDFPFIPARLFKIRDLLSVERSDVIKTMTSSGTTGQAVSKIFLDRKTSASQTKALARITSDFLGNKRLPMLVIDSGEALKNRTMFSARGAGILGFSMFGRDVTYALDDDMNLNFEAIDCFLEKHKGEDIFLFGFTFMIWEHFYRALIHAGRQLPIERGVMIHGGGWKKLSDEAVGSNRFKEALREVCGLSRIYNYYGMVEQTGSIFVECEYGHMHCSVYSDVLIRRHGDFSCAKTGERGLIEVLSLLPTSYPGHVLLTEDEGEILGEDDCPCGRLGRYFRIHGRVEGAEIRGCSDTYERR